MANVEKQGSLWNQATTAIGKLWNNISGKTSAMQHAAAEAEKQRQWEEHMSNTAYQRGSADMEAAGLNPAMMYSGGGGGGASTPHGAAAIGNQSGSESISGLINSAANLARSFNHDKNPKNDVSLKQVAKATTYMKHNGIKDLNKSTFSDLDNIKI